MSKYQLFQGNCIELLPQLGQFDCIFADPPDNIGLGYDEYDDKLETAKYIELLDDLVEFSCVSANIVWISFNVKWTFEMGRIFADFLSRCPDWEGKACTQVFTFGQHNKNDLGNNHRPLWRLRQKDAPLFPDAIKVPSWRQRNGDKRAAPGGRVPGDVFDMQYPTARPGLTDNYLKTVMENDLWPGDVFDFPRVTGNSKQRCDWHPTQLHEELVKRCVLLSTPEGGRVCDPFGGTGTTLRACREIGRDCALIELDEFYCHEIAKANGLKKIKLAKIWETN